MLRSSASSVDVAGFLSDLKVSSASSSGPASKELQLQQEVALRVLTNLAADDRYRAEIASKGGIPLVVALVAPNNDPALRVLAIWCLSNLAASNQQTQTAVGCNQPLLSHLKQLLQEESDNHDIVEKVLWLLSNVTSNNAQVKVAVANAGLIQQLVPFLSFDETRVSSSEVPLEALHFSETIIRATVQVFRNLFSQGWEIQSKFCAVSGSIRMAVKLLACPSPTIQNQITFLVWMLTIFNENVRKEIVSVGVIPLLTRLLVLSPDQSTQEQVIKVLMNLSANEEASSAFHQNRIVMPMIDFMKNCKNNETELAIVRTLVNLSYNEDLLKAVRQAGGVPPLVGYLSTKDDEFIQDLLPLIINLSTDERNRAALQRANAVAELKKIQSRVKDPELRSNMEPLMHNISLPIPPSVLAEEEAELREASQRMKAAMVTPSALPSVATATGTLPKTSSSSSSSPSSTQTIPSPSLSSLSSSPASASSSSTAPHSTPTSAPSSKNLSPKVAEDGSRPKDIVVDASDKKTKKPITSTAATLKKNKSGEKTKEKKKEKGKEKEKEKQKKKKEKSGGKGKHKRTSVKEEAKLLHDDLKSAVDATITSSGLVSSEGLPVPPLPAATSKTSKTTSPLSSPTSSKQSSRRTPPSKKLPQTPKSPSAAASASVPTKAANTSVTAVPPSPKALLSSSAPHPTAVAVAAPPAAPSLTRDEEQRLYMRRRFIAQEIMDTETHYVTALAFVIEKYYEPLTNKAKLGGKASSNLLTGEEVNGVFSYIEAIYSLNNSFCTDLKAQMVHLNANDTQLCLGDLFITTASFMKMYSSYINNFDNSIRLRDQLNKRSAWQKFIHDVFRQNQKRMNLSLDDLLIMPIQRVPRYRLLLQDLLKHTPPSHIDHPKLTLALEEIKKLGDYLNEAKRQAEGLNQVLALSKRITSLPSGEVIIMPGRLLNKQGHVLEYRKKGSSRYRYVLAFTDVLMLTQKKKDTFLFKCMLPFKGMQVQPLPDSIELRNAFKVRGGAGQELTLFVTKKEEQEEWVSHLQHQAN
ncbi:Rho guanine nucleotide exchange factor (GEF) 17 [Balamuthia mandrillaris]